MKYDYRQGEFKPNALSRFNIDRLSTSLIPPGSVVLEIGCATGFMSEYLEKEKNCTVIGVERNPNQAKMAEGRCHDVICGDIENQQTMERILSACERFGGVDVVFASAILEHLIYPDRTLRSFRRMLKIGGSIVATLPNVAHWSMRWRLLLGQWEYEDYGLLDRTHLRFFTFSTARRLFEKSGYRIVNWEIDPISGLPKIGSLLHRNQLLRQLTEHPLQRFYRRFPNFFAYQTVFHAVSEEVLDSHL